MEMDKILLQTAILRAFMVATFGGWGFAWYLWGEKVVPYLSAYMLLWLIVAFASLILARFGIGRGSV